LIVGQGDVGRLNLEKPGQCLELPPADPGPFLRRSQPTFVEGLGRLCNQIGRRQPKALAPLPDRQTIGEGKKLGLLRKERRRRVDIGNNVAASRRGPELRADSAGGRGRRLTRFL
jgi:hypothetical protein